ncbi:MAG TPA: hypothetical protein VGY14_03795 [Methyloceanibacter sp.]|nr:hypothetical protein [Methyloceanibacter sp.]
MVVVTFPRAIELLRDLAARARAGEPVGALEAKLDDHGPPPVAA